MSVIPKQDEAVPLKKAKARFNVLKWIGLGILFLCVPILPGWRFCFRVFYVPTAAMEPTLMGQHRTPDGKIIEGDRIIVERISYRFHSPQRGDVAVFKTEAIPAMERNKFQIPADEIYIKRIVGLPGEHVSIQPHSILINGQKLMEPKIFETLMAQTNVNPNAPVGFEPPKTDIQLGPGEYCVMGDNIMNSLDSRYYGAIKPDHFVGKALWIFSPAGRQGKVQ